MTKKSTFKQELSQYQIKEGVFENNGLPFLGANILEKGTVSETQTDFDGAFTILVPNTNALLVISYLGFVNQKVSVSRTNTISKNMKENPNLKKQYLKILQNKQYRTVPLEVFQC
ncbi:carboxypeptidase-like regulatory domain-containing protein [Formosa sp. 3Alg 14/1]|uniref:carboxypeptidase-like regulatory domain-containing protein n=1 Tax=Formosa sp. 3Alg 14/1 TaxID=3382190 RepID=UPI0039BDA5BD